MDEVDEYKPFFKLIRFSPRIPDHVRGDVDITDMFALSHVRGHDTEIGGSVYADNISVRGFLCFDGSTIGGDIIAENMDVNGFTTINSHIGGSIDAQNSEINVFSVGAAEIEGNVDVSDSNLYTFTQIGAAKIGDSFKANNSYIEHFEADGAHIKNNFEVNDSTVELFGSDCIQVDNTLSLYNCEIGYWDFYASPHAIKEAYIGNSLDLRGTSVQEFYGSLPSGDYAILMNEDTSLPDNLQKEIENHGFIEYS